MKYLSEIMENRQTELFNKKQVFFAFNKEQFEEGIWVKVCFALLKM
jgi:hypothetical protein